MSNTIAAGQPTGGAETTPSTPAAQPHEPQQPGAPAASPSPQTPDWRQTLPEDLRGVETLGKFKDVGALAKSYVELEKHVGGTLKMPTEKSTPEEWNAFYARLGRPDKPEGYEIKSPEDLPPGVNWSDEVAKSFSDVAHKIGLSKSQASALAEFYNGVVSEQAKGYWTAERGLAALGSDEKQVNAVVSGVQRLVKAFADQETLEFLDEAGRGNDPRLLRFLNKISAKFLAEDSLPTNTAPDQEGLGVNEARAEIARIKNDLSHAWHRGDKDATAYMTKLYDIVYGRKVVVEI